MSGASWSDIKFLSGLSDAYGLRCGLWSMWILLPQQSLTLFRSRGASCLVYAVTANIDSLRLKAALIVSGHVSLPAYPVTRCRPAFRAHTEKIKKKQD